MFFLFFFIFYAISFESKHLKLLFLKIKNLFETHEAWLMWSFGPRLLAKIVSFYWYQPLIKCFGFEIMEYDERDQCNFLRLHTKIMLTITLLYNTSRTPIQQTFSYSKSTIETIEKKIKVNNKYTRCLLLTLNIFHNISIIFPLLTLSK